MTVSVRSRNAAVILLLVACGATGYYLFAGRGPGNVHIRADAAPSQRDNSAVPAAKQVARFADVKPPPGMDAAEEPATPSLEGMTVVNCRRAFIGSRPVKRAYCDHVRPNDTLGMRQCQELLVSDALHTQTMRGEAAACPAALASASGYYAALRAAAQAGDAGAQRCFIQGYFDDPQDGDYISQQQREDYDLLVKEYISSGLQRGDWRVVRWLARVSLYAPDGLLYNAYHFGSSAPETIYRMNLLLTLGGAADTAVERPQSVVKYVSTSGELSDRQIQDAQAWARETYSTYFAATPYDGRPTTSFCR